MLAQRSNVPVREIVNQFRAIRSLIPVSERILPERIVLTEPFHEVEHGLKLVVIPDTCSVRRVLNRWSDAGRPGHGFNRLSRLTIDGRYVALALRFRKVELIASAKVDIGNFLPTD